MSTLTSNEPSQECATGVRFIDNTICVALGNGKEIGLSLDRTPWLDWLAKASKEQRANWCIEPGGFAIYWNDLDDGIEVRHLMEMQSPQLMA